MKTCPYCANDIQDAAIKCQFCGERLDSAPVHASPPAPARRKRKGHPLLMLYALAGVAAFVGAALYLRDDRPLAAAVAVGAAIIFIPVAIVAWVIGDFIRRFANPSAYFVSGGALALAQERLYWMIGPQSVAVFFVFAALGGLVVFTAAQQDNPTATAAASTQPTAPPEQTVAVPPPPRAALGPASAPSTQNAIPAAEPASSAAPANADPIPLPAKAAAASPNDLPPT